MPLASEKYESKQEGHPSFIESLKLEIENRKREIVCLEYVLKRSEEFPEGVKYFEEINTYLRQVK